MAISGVEVLVRSGVTGKLFTGKGYVLQYGPVAVETYLGWVLIKKFSSRNKEKYKPSYDSGYDAR